ncbi:MAG TPA: cytochrome c oxidase assembly protein [Chloroflexota bacterium]
MDPKLAAFLASWTWEPIILFGLTLAAGLYALGWWRLRRRGRVALPAWRAGCYAGGLVALAVALLSPVATYGSLFFFLHMIQHLLMMIVAAPLILLGAPLLPLLWSLPPGARREVGLLFVSGRPLHRVFHALTHPLVAAAIYLSTVAVWHVPAFYDAAQGRTLVHDLEHVMFLGAALLYWWPVVHPTGGRRRLSYALALPYLFVAMLEGNLLGALITFARAPLYPTYEQVPRVWGLSVMDDQQLGGLIMWIPGGTVYLIPMFVFLALLLGGEERAVEEAGSGSSAARRAG